MVTKEKSIKGLLVSKIKELISQLEDDLFLFGKSRKHILRGIFNILEELLLESYQITEFLERLKTLSGYFFYIKDKINFLSKLAIYYWKTNNEAESLNIIDKCLSLSHELSEFKDRSEAILSIISGIIKMGKIDIGNELVIELLNLAESLSIFDRIILYSRLGVIISNYDVGKGDSLVMYSRDLIDKLDYSRDRARALIIVARSLLEISKDRENQRIARNWLSEALRLLDYFDEVDYIDLISESIGDIFLISSTKASQLVSEIINLTRPNKFGFEKLLTILEKLYEARAEDLGDRVRRIILNRLNKSSLITPEEKLLYLSRLAACDALIDTYLANYTGKIIMNSLSRKLSKISQDSINTLLKTIKWFSNIDMQNSFIFYTIATSSSNRSENLRNMIDIYMMFSDIFPKTILQKVIELYENVLENNNDCTSCLTELLSIIIKLSNNYERYVREAIKIAMKINNAVISLKMIADIAKYLHIKNPTWADELIDYCLEETNSMDPIEAAKILIHMSERIAKENSDKAKDILKNAIRMLEKNHERKEVPELLSIISKKMRDSFGDIGWARQLELLSNEMKAKKRKFFKHQ